MKNKSFLLSIALLLTCNLAFGSDFRKYLQNGANPIKLCFDQDRRGQVSCWKEYQRLLMASASGSKIWRQPTTGKQRPETTCVTILSSKYVNVVFVNNQVLVTPTTQKEGPVAHFNFEFPSSR